MQRFIFFIFYACLILFPYTNLQAQKKLDSLLSLLSKTGQDSNRVLILLEIRKIHGKSAPLQAFEVGKEALELSQKLNYTNGLAGAYAAIGSFYRQQGDYAKATEYQIYALQEYEKLNRYTGISSASNNLGVLYYRQGNWKEALKYYRKSLFLAQKYKESVDEATYLLNIGEVHQELQNYDSAIYYEVKTIKISQKLDIQDNIAYALGIIGQVSMAQKRYAEALNYEQQALLIFEKLDDKDAIAEYQADIANLYLLLKNYSLAIEYAEKCLQTAQHTGSKQWEKEAYLALANIAESQKQFEKAHQYFKRYTSLKDSIFNDNSTQKMQQVQAIYETEKKQSEILLLRKNQQVQDKQIQLQTLLLYLGAVMVLLILIFAFWLYKNNRQKQQTNNILQKQKQAIEQQHKNLEDKQNEILLKNVELEQQKEEMLAQAENLLQAHEEIMQHRDLLETQNTQIKKKNENIESSIRYAKRIQKAFLPSDEHLAKAFASYCIFYQPKDIVSGDFYWLHQEENQIILAVADCTGHGVPGALMSMMGNSLLNQIVKDKQVCSPNLILDALHEGIRNALHQHDSENRDGMDIALLTITQNTNSVCIEYSGANNSLLFFENQQLQEWRADKMAIGGYQQEKERHFTNQKIEIHNKNKSNYTFYLFSDGYQDQFGGENIRKIGKAGFKKLLAQLQTMEMPQQTMYLEKYFVEWQKTQDQIDDVLVLGFMLY